MAVNKVGWDAEDLKQGKDALYGKNFFQHLVEQGDCIEEVKGFSNFVPKNHYVLGAQSPFLFRAGLPLGNKGKQGKHEFHVIYAVYCSHDAENGLGAVHGGAIAAIMDFGIAICGLLARTQHTFGATKDLSIKYKKFTPLQKVLRLDVFASFDMETGIANARGELSDGADETLVYSEAVATLVDVPLRKKFRDSQKSML